MYMSTTRQSQLIHQRPYSMKTKNENKNKKSILKFQVYSTERAAEVEVILPEEESRELLTAEALEEIFCGASDRD